MNKILIVILSFLSLSAHAQIDNQKTNKNKIATAEIISMPVDDEAKLYKKQAQLALGKEPLMLEQMIIKMDEKYYSCSSGGPSVICWPIESKNKISKAEIISMPIDDGFEAKLYKFNGRWMLDKEPIIFKHIIIKTNEQYYNCSGNRSSGVICWLIENKKR